VPTKAISERAAAVGVSTSLSRRARGTVPNGTKEASFVMENDS
jgi:hypothetical protein